MYEIPKDTIIFYDENRITFQGVSEKGLQLSEFDKEIIFSKPMLYLKNKSQGGSGPYQVIARKDPYSQRWCKFVMEIDLQ